MLDQHDYNLLEEIEKFQKKFKGDLDERVKIICTRCKENVGYIIPSELDLPLRGHMIHPLPGCENWPLPLPHMGPLEFMCPHAAHEEGDRHLFVNIIDGEADKTDWFLGADHKPFNITSVASLCPCGCGEKKEGNKQYADGLYCYRRHMAKQKEGLE